MADFSGELVASYSVEIDGVDRTRAELARLSNEITLLRKAEYSPAVPSVTVASQLGGKDIFQASMDQLEGRVQTAASKAMLSAVQLGHESQTKALDAAVTTYGAERFARGRGGSSGRHDTGGIIKAIKHNVETFKNGGTTLITGWHGWPTGDRLRRVAYQEKGTRGQNAVSKRAVKKAETATRKAIAKGGTGNGGIPPANSLGLSIPLVREHLKRELGKLKR